MASREAYAQRRISQKFTVAEKNYNQWKHSNRKLRPVVQDQCWVDSICKTFDLFVLFCLFIASLFLFWFCFLASLFKEGRMLYFWSHNHLARLKCREESKGDEASVANWNLRPFVLVKWWNDYNWKKWCALVLSECTRNDKRVTSWLLHNSPDCLLVSHRGVQPTSRDSHMPSRPIHDYSLQVTWK